MFLLSVECKSSRCFKTHELSIMQRAIKLTNVKAIKNELLVMSKGRHYGRRNYTYFISLHGKYHD